MKKITNTRNGYHFNSKYWQDWKARTRLPMIDSKLFQLILGMVLSDATMYRVSHEALVKFEQGGRSPDQKEFLFHLFQECKEYCFMTEPGIRKHIHGAKQGEVKSYWFKTFSHKSFAVICDLFYDTSNGVIKKTIKAPEGGGTILTHLNVVGLAYWVIGDGSLHREGRVLTLHTQGFSHDENKMISEELNLKFGFKSKVVKHKNKFVVQFTTSDANKLHDLIKPHLIPTMQYKLPRKL